MAISRGWYSRGYLPHIDIAGRAQFLTWRLWDAVPKDVADAFRRELDKLPPDEARKEHARRIEAYCDAGHGSCLLGDHRVARVVQEKLFQLDGEFCKLHAWVLMPNHAHAILTPAEGITLETLVRRLKGSSSREANRVLKRSGQLWQYDFFDRLLRDEDHFERTRRYVEWNPVKANLCSDPTRWPWSSANEHAVARIESLRGDRGAS